MGAAVSVETVPEILKYVWDNEVEDYQYEDAPYYAMVEKDTSWEGEFQIITVKTAHAGGQSGNFQKAQANKRAGKFYKMQVETSDNFVLWSVDKKLISLSRGDKGSLVRALTDATSDAQTRFKMKTCWSLWRNGGGAIGKIASSGISGAVVTLDDKDDIRNFEEGDVIEFAADDGVAAGGVYSGTLTVSSLDEEDGTITFDDNLSTISGLSAGGFLFQEGDYNNVLKGVTAYVTLDDPGSSGVPSSIWNMTRTASVRKLSGLRLTGSNDLISEEITAALVQAKRFNMKVTHLFMAPELLQDLANSLEGQKRYEDTKVGNIGFEALIFVTPNGQKVKCYGDPAIPRGLNGERLVFGLYLDSFKLHSSEEYPMWLTEDGSKRFMTEVSANASEGRIGGYAQHYTKGMGHCFVLALS